MVGNNPSLNACEPGSLTEQSGQRRSCLIVSSILIDFSLTVKAATLIFISGSGSAISSAKKGNQVLFIIW